MQNKGLDTIVKTKVAKRNGQALPEIPGSPQKNLPPSRVGKRVVQGWYDPEVRRQLGVIAAKEDKSIERVLGDAINGLFEKYGIPPIA